MESLTRRGARPNHSDASSVAAPENVHASEAAAFEDLGAARGFEQRQTCQHNYERAEIEGVPDERADDLKGRIRETISVPTGTFVCARKSPTKCRPP